MRRAAALSTAGMAAPALGQAFAPERPSGPTAAEARETPSSWASIVRPATRAAAAAMSVASIATRALERPDEKNMVVMMDEQAKRDLTGGGELPHVGATAEGDPPAPRRAAAAIV